MQNIIFIHGLESSGEGFKSKLLRSIFSNCLTPTFMPYSSKIPIKILLEKRMEQLISILTERKKWIIIGSSFGGLMATLYTCKFPSSVSKLILLAPYLSLNIQELRNFPPINIPVLIYHGINDDIVPWKSTKLLAEKIFLNLTYNIVEDDHSLFYTVKALDWKHLIKVS